MRAHVWGTALVVAAAFGLRANAASPVVISKQNIPQAQTSSFTPLRLTSFVQPSSKFLSFFPSIPSINQTNGVIARKSIPLTNGQPNADYFKMFNLQSAAPPRSQPTILAVLWPF